MLKFKVKEANYIASTVYGYNFFVLAIENNKKDTIPTDFSRNIGVEEILSFYKMEKLTLINILKQYDGNSRHIPNLPIFFKTIENAQKFIDDFLIPYEIAFNLNGEYNV